MRISTAAVASALATLAAAKSQAIVQNSCDFPVYIWSVGSEIEDVGEVAQDKTWSQDLVRDPVTGGLAIKITTEEDGLHNGAPQTIFAYTLDPDRVFYDLSEVFGSAFEGHKVALEPSDEECESIVWEDGSQPSGSAVKSCQPETDLRLTLCAE
ncbi:hypothetical protein VUR80DRAFT_6112 [Thermomyces stellatus]